MPGPKQTAGQPDSDVRLFRRQTLSRFGDLKRLGILGSHDSIIVDHIIACDTLLLGEDVEAHRVPPLSQGAPDRSNSSRTAQEEANSCLIFANHGMVAAALQSLRTYIGEFHSRRAGPDAPHLPAQILSWNAVVDRAAAALESLRSAGFTGPSVHRVTGAWTELTAAIREARQAYGPVGRRSEQPLSTGERVIIFLLIAGFLFLWLFSSRYLC